MIFWHVTLRKFYARDIDKLWCSIINMLTRKAVSLKSKSSRSVTAMTLFIMWNSICQFSLAEWTEACWKNREWRRNIWDFHFKSKYFTMANSIIKGKTADDFSIKWLQVVYFRNFFVQSIILSLNFQRVDWYTWHLNFIDRHSAICVPQRNTWKMKAL